MVRVTLDVVEYYNPFGMRPSLKMLSAIKKVIGRRAKRQFKMNRIQDQSITSQNCGWFSMKFLDDMAAGKHFKEVTRFNKLGEKEIAKYKLKYKAFGTL